MTAAQGTCVYCGREMWLAGLEPCCDHPGHEGLVCTDIRGCVDVVLARLHAASAAAGDDEMNESSTHATTADRQLASIRAVFDVFDWETDDRQYALEQIEEIVKGGGGR